MNTTTFELIRMPAGHTIEEGANWIHGVENNNNPLLDLARAAQVKYYITTQSDTIKARDSNKKCACFLCRPDLIKANKLAEGMSQIKYYAENFSRPRKSLISNKFTLLFKAYLMTHESYGKIKVENNIKELLITYFNNLLKVILLEFVNF